MDVEGDTVSKVVSLRAMDGQTVMWWKQVQKVDFCCQVGSHLIRTTQLRLILNLLPYDILDFSYEYV